MLVTFRCNAHENITMFGDVAKELLKLMGQSGTVPSAIKAKDVSQALMKLTAALEEKKTAEPPQPPETDDDTEEPISLTHRAIPLIQLLKDAIKHNCDVLWS